MKFPHYKQLDSMDCGPTCLRMIAEYYGKSYSLQYLRKHSYITREGVSMLGVSDAAECIGFRTHGYRLTWEQLKNEVPLPCIVHWNQRHFIIIYDIKKENCIHLPFSSMNGREYMVSVADPAVGLLRYKKDEFLRFWYCTKSDGIEEGTALLLEPTPEFYKQEENR